MLEGQCLCGDITYKLPGNLHDWYHGNCVECRRVSGASQATNAFVSAADLAIKDPKKVLCTYALESGHRYFCSQCGSPLYSQAAEAGEFVSLHCGSLSNPPHKLLDANFWTAEKCPWTTLVEGVTNFEHAPIF